MYIGAIDIGGSKTIAGIVNENGELLIEKQIVTEKSDCAAHFNRCAALLLEAAAEYGVPAQALEGVGVSLPGMVDHSHSVLLLAPGAGWRDFPAAEFLREALGIRALWCENDVNNCARAELRFAGAPENFLWITVSTGIGGAVVADGRVLLGCNSLAGELGHCKVEFEHPLPCPCGSRGCLEAHASGAALSRRFALLLAEDPQAAALARER
uniref:ROK family protein n=5 Tax=Oscillospiraceae TaxID=216572 RepID=UPI003A854159